MGAVGEGRKEVEGRGRGRFLGRERGKRREGGLNVEVRERKEVFAQRESFF